MPSSQTNIFKLSDKNTRPDEQFFNLNISKIEPYNIALYGDAYFKY